MQKRLYAFFQHMPPFGGASALRGASVVRGILEVWSDPDLAVKVFTTTNNPANINGVVIATIQRSEVKNNQNIYKRVLGELYLGIVASIRMFVAKEKCDYAIISSPGYLSALILSMCARFYRVPYAIDLRDVYPEVYAAAGLLSERSVIYRVLKSASIKMYTGAEVVVAATNGIADSVNRIAVDARVKVVYNGFPSSLLSRACEKRSRFTVVFHGVLGFFQDVNTLIKVAEKLELFCIDVVVVGYGRGSEIIEAYRGSNLIFYGMQPHDKTIEIIEKCHLGLCLRKNDFISKDSFPVKVWEYLGLGIPTIVTPRCEAGEFLEQNGCGYQFDSGSVGEMIEKINEIRSNPDSAFKKSSQARFVAAKFTREETGKTVAFEMKSAFAFSKI